MSLDERSGARDLTINRAHRLYLGRSKYAIDIDLAGACYGCGTFFYILDTTMESQREMHAPYLRLALTLDVPAFVVHYRPESPCRCQPTGAIDPSCDHGLPEVTVHQVLPTDWTRTMSGRAFFDLLDGLWRPDHFCDQYQITRLRQQTLITA